MNDVRVRKAFSLSLDREALAKFRRVAKPLSVFIPAAFIRDIPLSRETHSTPNVRRSCWQKRDIAMLPAISIRQNSPSTRSNIPTTPPTRIARLPNCCSPSGNRISGITVTLKNMETRTFFTSRNKLEYLGFSRSGWFGDYMDPYTFLSMFQTPTGNNGTGWWEKSYVDKLDDANRTHDPVERFGNWPKPSSSCWTPAR